MQASLIAGDEFATKHESPPAYHNAFAGASWTPQIAQALSTHSTLILEAICLDDIAPIERWGRGLVVTARPGEGAMADALAIRIGSYSHGSRLEQKENKALSKFQWREESVQGNSQMVYVGEGDLSKRATTDHHRIRCIDSKGATQEDRLRSSFCHDRNWVWAQPSDPPRIKSYLTFISVNEYPENVLLWNFGSNERRIFVHTPLALCKSFGNRSIGCP
jgi:hypothetical protein